jgi:hypothetical protein
LQPELIGELLDDLGDVVERLVKAGRSAAATSSTTKESRAVEEPKEHLVGLLHGRNRLRPSTVTVRKRVGGISASLATSSQLKGMSLSALDS